MADVEEQDIDRLLANPPEKVEIEVKYKIAVTVMEGVSQTILKKVILVLLKISRMIKSKCTFRFSGCSWHTGLFLLLNKQRLNNRKLLLSRINYHRRSEFTEKIVFCKYCSHRILSLLIIQSIISYKNQKHFNQFTMSLLFCVILFYRFFLPLYLPLSEFVNTDGTI